MPDNDHAAWAALYGVFAEQPGGGSVAGVVISHTPLSSDRMQAVARDLAAPTTGFVVLPGRADDELPIRFFSPRQEMDACGYVTLAAATALRDTGYWTAPSTRSLTATTARYVLALTADAVRLAVPVRDHRVLGDAEKRAIGGTLGVPLTDRPCEVVTTGLRHLVVPLADDAALSAFTPDRATAEQLGDTYTVDTIALISGHTTPGVCRLRDLCAPVGDLEEPASGTTAAAVTDYMHRHHDVSRLVVRQGESLGRPSILRTTIRPGRVVDVAGRARPVLTGRLH